MNSTMKKIARPLFHVMWHLGFDPLRVASFRHYPKYLSQKKRFRELGGGVTHRFPIFSDYEEQAGAARGHYFHQDLLVAALIHEAHPDRHIDIGSRIDGFVAHVAAFREIDVMDVRDLNSTGHSNISFIKADLMNKNSAQEKITDSISCLHAIEHFGLGRYGDPIDPDGHKKGFNNIARMLKRDGRLYISFPIGRSNEVHFNAHRVFHPKDVFSWMDPDARLQLERFDYVDDAGDLQRNVNLDIDTVDVAFGCGIYTFKKLA